MSIEKKPMEIVIKGGDIHRIALIMQMASKYINSNRRGEQHMDTRALQYWVDDIGPDKLKEILKVIATYTSL